MRTLSKTINCLTAVTTLKERVQGFSLCAGKESERRRDSRRVNVSVVNLNDFVSVDLSDVGNLDRDDDISVCCDILAGEGNGVC